MSESEQQRLSDAGAAIALCPTSNLFLGSGLVQSERLAQRNIQLSLGTDVGGGTSFSMLQTMHEMYKVARTVGEYLSPVDLFGMATLCGAKSLHIDQFVGNFEVGKEADFVVLDDAGRRLTKHKIQKAGNIDELLFSYIITGGQENVKETWSMGQCVYQRAPNSLDDRCAVVF